MTSISLDSPFNGRGRPNIPPHLFDELPRSQKSRIKVSLRLERESTHKCAWEGYMYVNI